MIFKLKRTKAFTIIELMTVVAIVAIVAAIAVPSVNNLILNNRLAAFSNDFINSVALARSKAITNRAEVEIKPNSGGWQKGWTVVSNGETLNSIEELSGITISTNPSALKIKANGLLDGLKWDGIKACDSRSKCREISVTGAGITTVTKS